MPTLHAFVIYCTVYAIAIAVPGPGIVAIVARALAGGFRATIPAAVGTVFGDLVVMTLSVLGLALVAKALGTLFLAVKLGGALYLIYLGYRYWTAPVSEDPSAAVSAGSGLLSQFALTIGNPKAITFFVALLPTVIDLNTLNLAGYAQLCAATVILIPAITLSYAALAAQVRGLMGSVTARRRINKTAALVMTGAGIGVAVS